MFKRKLRNCHLSSEQSTFQALLQYRKSLKFSDSQNVCSNHPEGLSIDELSIDADRITKSVDPDQTAPLGAV